MRRRSRERFDHGASASYTSRMRRSFVALNIVGAVASFGLADAHAEAPTPASRGALVVALGANATPATKALAREVYRDERLQPNVDEPTARVLAGEAVAPDATLSLQSLARIRESLPVAPDDLGAKLIAVIGQERHADIVVAVSMTADRPTARVVRVGSAKYESVIIEGTTERGEGDVVRYSWPGATTILHQLFIAAPAPPSPQPQTSGAIAPRKIDSAPPKLGDKGSSWYKSPWFWGPLGAVVATGAAILIASQVTKDDVDTVRLRGRVGP
jgi:hypothetical protein